MKTVWKYQLAAYLATYDLHIPENAEFLFVREQHRVPTMWFLVDSEARQEERRFIIAGTGEKIDDRIFPWHRYLGSFFLDGGNFVGHVFEVRI